MSSTGPGQSFTCNDDFDNYEDNGDEDDDGDDSDDDKKADGAKTTRVSTGPG